MIGGNNSSSISPSASSSTSSISVDNVVDWNEAGETDSTSTSKLGEGTITCCSGNNELEEDCTGGVQSVEK